MQFLVLEKSTGQHSATPPRQVCMMDLNNRDGDYALGGGGSARTNHVGLAENQAAAS